MIAICIFICKTLQVHASSRYYLAIVFTWKMMFSRNSSSHRSMLDESAFVVRARFQIGCIRLMLRADDRHPSTHTKWSLCVLCILNWWLSEHGRVCVENRMPATNTGFRPFFFSSEFRIYFRSSRNHVKVYEKENTFKLIKVTMHSSFVQASRDQAHMKELFLTLLNILLALGSSTDCGLHHFAKRSNWKRQRLLMTSLETFKIRQNIANHRNILSEANGCCVRSWPRIDRGQVTARTLH